MESKYGTLPILVDTINIPVTEQMLYLYLPIKMAKTNLVQLPHRLRQFYPLLWKSVLSKVVSNRDYFDSYIYITAKHMLVHPEFWGNRGGFHCDGFLTEDRNWIWYDKNPTIFNTSDFNITPDHNISMEEFEKQADCKNDITYPEFSLLELNPYVVHKVAPVTKYDMRTFVKISLSKDKYNLVGNSHNYLFNYDWKMYDRQEVRNSPVYAELSNSDYIPDDIA